MMTYLHQGLEDKEFQKPESIYEENGQLKNNKIEGGIINGSNKNNINSDIFYNSTSSNNISIDTNKG